MAQLTNEQVTVACKAHYPEWSSFGQNERDALCIQMRQTLQAYESAKSSTAPSIDERNSTVRQTMSTPWHLMDIASKTSTPAAFVPLPAADLVRRCAEIVDWQKTGILKGDALRTFAQKRWPNEHDSLQIAEKETAREVLAYLVSMFGSFDEISAYTARHISACPTDATHDQ